MNDEIDLKPTMLTYLRLFGVILADLLSVISLYMAIDPILATLASLGVIAVTAIAAWKNNSITTGAIAADAMKEVLTDAANVDTVTGTWHEVQSTAGKVYKAIKEQEHV